MLGELDIAAYSCRVGHSDVSVSDLAALTELHQAQASTIAFENLDIQMGRPVRLDLDTLQTKLIHRRGSFSTRRLAQERNPRWRSWGRRSRHRSLVCTTL